MAKSKAQIQQQLQALYEDYARRLPEKLDALKQSWGKLKTQNWDDENLKVFHRQAHTLAGSGATFGFPAVSTNARKLEKLLKPQLESGKHGLNEQDQTRVDSLLSKLHDIAINTKQILDLQAEALVVGDAKSGSEHNNDLIYIFDDNEVVARNLALQISHYGYEVQTFARLELLENEVDLSMPAAIVMDIMFPGNDTAGIEAIRQLRCKHKLPPVIFVSAHGSLAARIDAAYAGGKAYFDKPVDAASMATKLDELTAKVIAEPYRILIVDDNVELSKQYSLVLQHAGMVTQVVSDPMRVMEPLAEFYPELILMDMYMPNCTGMDLAKVIRQQDAYVSIPLVFLSTETDIDKQLSAMREGGDDFLTKPISSQHLIEYVTIRAERYRRLRKLMERDSLTGLFNHNNILEQLEIEIERAKRSDQQLAFAMLDIDHFKSINDNFGHLTGDRVIISFARLLQRSLRRGDIIGRYGGEEFAVILPNTSAEQAQQVLDKLRERFASIKHVCSEGQTKVVTVSCGIAMYPDFLEGTELNEAADKALYQAKHAGRNQSIILRREQN